MADNNRDRDERGRARGQFTIGNQAAKGIRWKKVETARNKVPEKCQIRPIARRQAAELIGKFHYSKLMPRLTKLELGLFYEEKLVGCCTLGWGVRPVHTIKKIFPSLRSIDYLEIGKLCVSDEMPRNTESIFLSGIIKWLKSNRPEIKILFSWSDAIIGKPGYVYQAANFFYGGHIWTRMYLDGSGTRIHRRTMQGLTGIRGNGKMGCISHATTNAQGFQLWYGMMFRYCFPLCSRGEWKELVRNSECEWQRANYPKISDIRWKKQVDVGTLVEQEEMPPFVATLRIAKDRDQLQFFGQTLNASEVSRAIQPAIQQVRRGDDSTTTLHFPAPYYWTP